MLAHGLRQRRWPVAQGGQLGAVWFEGSDEKVVVDVMVGGKIGEVTQTPEMRPTRASCLATLVKLGYGRDDLSEMLIFFGDQLVAGPFGPLDFPTNNEVTSVVSTMITRVPIN